jgi:hypothetical protein
MSLRTKELMQVLEKFNKGEVGGYARVQIVSRENKWRPKDIKEIKLVENKLIGATEKHRLFLLVD